MIAIDANILVYAHRAESVDHDRAVRILEDLVRGGAPFAIPWPCVHEFVSVVTNYRIFKPATPLADALGCVRSWTACPNLLLLAEGDHHLDQLADLAIAGDTMGAMIHDAKIAAICLSHGVTELWTADRDFSRFPKLKIRNPLV